jgi:hypothetical protein
LPYWDWSDEATRETIFTDKYFGSKGQESDNYLVKDGSSSSISFLLLLLSDSSLFLPRICFSIGLFKNWPTVVSLDKDGKTVLQNTGLSRCLGCMIVDFSFMRHPSFSFNATVAPTLPTLKDIVDSMELGAYDTPPWDDSRFASWSFCIWRFSIL